MGGGLRGEPDEPRGWRRRQQGRGRARGPAHSRPLTRTSVSGGRAVGTAGQCGLCSSSHSTCVSPEAPGCGFSSCGHFQLWPFIFSYLKILLKKLLF